MQPRYLISEQDALVLVDLQNDFCPGGALPVPDGDLVVPLLDRLQKLFGTVVATRDWHPANHCSFAAQGGPWPAHCVAGTLGAQYHPELELVPTALQVVKADAPDVESYSGFNGTPDLAAELRQHGITRLFIGGLATDYCVLQTVLGARAEGFETVVLTDAVRPVDVRPGDGDAALDEMVAAGAIVAESGQIVGAA